MKRKIVTILMMALLVSSLSACGKEKEQGESITKIEASDAAESKEATERKYEDTNKEPVVAPDRNGSSNTDLAESNENTTDEDTLVDMDPTIYGTWMSNDGTNITIFNSSQGVKFNMFDATIEEYITGDATTDDSTYIEVTYQKPEEPVEESQEVIDPETGEVIASEENTEEESDSHSDMTDEEFYAALEAERQAQYETIRYSIERNEFNKETQTMYLTLSGSGRTIELSMEVTAHTPDLSKEDNSLAKDMVEEEDNAPEKKEVEE